MSLVLELGGRTAWLAESDGERVVLWADGPAPPGMTLRGTFRDQAFECTIKVLRCRRENGSARPPFRVEGRFVNLSRGARQQVLAACEADRREPRDPG